jgi:hypothetical protein
VLLWELACLRIGRHIQHHLCLASRLRRQASSHRIDDEPGICWLACEGAAGTSTATLSDPTPLAYDEIDNVCCEKAVREIYIATIIK